MLHYQTLQVLFLVGVSLSTCAAPLGSLIHKTDCGSKKTTEHLVSHPDDLCVVSSTQPPLSTDVQELGETVISESGRHEEYKQEVAVTDTTMQQIGQSELVKRTAESYMQYYLDSSPDKSSAKEESIRSTLSAPPFETLTVDRTVGFKKTVALLVTFTPTAQKKIEQGVLSSTLPFYPNTNRPVQKTSSHSIIEKAMASVKPPLFKKEGGLEVEASRKNKSTNLSFKTQRLISTEAPLIVSASSHESSWTINPAVAALTTLSSFHEQAEGLKENKGRAAEKKLLTATELRNKALGPRLLQPDLTLSSKLVELGETWTESVHLQDEEASLLPSSQEVSTEATMSSKDLPLIFEDVTPSSSSVPVSELSVSMVSGTGMLKEAELEQTVSRDTDQTPRDGPLPEPSDSPTHWQMSGAENSDTIMTSQMSTGEAFYATDTMKGQRDHKDPDFILTPVGVPRWSPSVLATTQKVTTISPTYTGVLKPTSGLEELHSEEDEEDEDLDEPEEEEKDDESEEEQTEAPEHSPTRSPYSLIPPPPDWGQRNQGLIRSWFELIQEKAGYVSGMLAPIGIGIAGALVIVGVLYGIRMIHRKRKNSIKQQRRKQTTEVRHRHDHAMLLADSSEDEF